MIVNDKLLNRYRYALCNERIISIDDVTKEDRKLSKFTCLGCGHEMVPVLGKVREHHFRHKNNENCRNETYLHNLGKNRIKEIFDTQKHFYIHYNATNTCELLGSCPFHVCKKEFKSSYDLKEYFDTCEIEKGCGKFIPDILLTHSNHPNRKLFIEINVNHPCSIEKLNSGFRIIEIDVSSEQSISSIYSLDEEKDNIHFFNFKRDIIPLKKVDRLSIILRDGKRKITQDCLTLDSIVCTESQNHLDDCSMDVILKEKDKSINLTYQGLALCMQKRFEVMNCDFCFNRNKCKPIMTIIEDKNGRTLTIKKLFIDEIKGFDKWQHANNCPNYIPNYRGSSFLISKIRSYNYILWEKNNQKSK